MWAVLVHCPLICLATCPGTGIIGLSIIMLRLELMGKLKYSENSGRTEFNQFGHGG